MQIGSAQQNSLVSAVVDRLRNYIEAKKLSAGERLPTEAVLLEQLHVSRSVLREAVGRLETIGLVSVRRGQGMFVGDPDTLSSCVNLVRSAMTMCPRDLTQFFEFRSALECWTARRAAEVAQPEDISELESLCEQMDRQDQSYEDTIQADFAFHRKLFEIAGNQLMFAVSTVLQQWTLAGMLQTTPKPRDYAASRRLHRAILKGVRDGDPDAAEKAMLKHMESVRHSAEKHRGAQAG
jgi:GntR family transcriptional regulator, transcriptional repressor for pyruvate dehydrogenase complex